MIGKKEWVCLVSGAVICFFGLSACRDGSSPNFTLEKKFDLDGDGVTPFFEPGGMAVDFDGNIYVADSGNQRVVKFDSGGRFIKIMGSKGKGPGEFLCPWQVVIHNREMIVYDWRRNIQRFTLDGDYISGFNLGRGIYIDCIQDSMGDLYLNRITSIDQNMLIEKYDIEGNLINRFCEPEDPPSRPLALIYNMTRICLDENDDIYIAFKYINKIRKYNNDGELLTEFNRNLSYTPIKPVHTPDQNKPFLLHGITGDICCDGNNRLYVLSDKIWNADGHLIDVLNPEQTFLGSFYSGFLGEELPAESELSRDQSLAFDHNQNLYILDHGAMKVRVLKIRENIL